LDRTLEDWIGWGLVPGTTTTIDRVRLETDELLVKLAHLPVSRYKFLLASRSPHV
jgi:hypothetical protein